MRVLITDGNERVSLAAARSLVRAGHSVVVTAPTRWSLAGVSRGVTSHPLAVDPLINPAGYVTELGRIGREQRTDILLATTDASLEAVLEHATKLPRDLQVPGPDLASYRAASNKWRILQLAAACGFGTPETRVLEAAGAQSGRDLADLLPAFIKPHRSIVSGLQQRRKLAVIPVTTVAACDAALSALPPEAYPVLVQRQVSGAGEGIFALRWAGRIIALFAHRRLREKPPSGGVSVYRESIRLTDELAHAAGQMLEALDWQGVAMIECKRDAQTGRPIVMEVNGRLWGSLQLAIDAGVDFPALLVRCAAGERVPAVRDYRTGVRSRWFWGDVDNLLLRLRADAGVGAVLDFLRTSVSRSRNEIWRWTDPLPSLVETLQWFGLLTRNTAGAKPKSTVAPRECVPDSAVR